MLEWKEKGRWEEILGYQAGGRGDSLVDFTEPMKIKKNKFQDLR